MNNNQEIRLKRDQQIVVGIDEEMPTTMNIHLGGRRKLSMQEKIARAAKAQATRMARGTMGPRQRALLASTVAR